MPLHLSSVWKVSDSWRHSLTLLVMFAPLVILLSMPPIIDSPTYHDFADQRTWLRIPNFLDVISSLPYLLVGIAGIGACRNRPPGSSWHAWLTCFTGVALVGAGSAYYHWNPSHDTLFWDRLPMTLGFTALFVAILADYINPRLGKPLLVPMILMGIASVIYGYLYDDLRFYAWIQALPLLAILIAVFLCRARYTHRGYLLLAFAFYLLAKFAELCDRQVFDFTMEFFSGHTLKHLLGALAIWAILHMIRRRTLITGMPDA